jgi:hypothetical protein
VVRHWQTVIRPLLVAAMARVVVEVGLSLGQTTKKLLEWITERDGVMHGIEPAPRVMLEVEELQKQYADHFVFHQALSLDALPRIRDADAVLIDGDHNWYTVHEELRAIEQVAREEGRPYPLTLLHDVDWPYGRRDMYHDPETIPDEFRQQWSKGGMMWGVSELVGEAGFNPSVNHALVEGTPRNGVRTAVEDFLAETDLKLEWTSVTGFFGLGILADETLLERTPALREGIDFLHSPEFLQEQLRLVEMSRVSILTRLHEHRRELRAMRRAARSPARNV